MKSNYSEKAVRKSSIDGYMLTDNQMEILINKSTIRMPNYDSIIKESYGKKEEKR